MNVALVNTDGSDSFFDKYKYFRRVTRALKSLDPPLFLVRWTQDGVDIERHLIIPDYFKFSKEIVPENFMELLFDFHKSIHLHFFSNVPFDDNYATQCESICKKYNRKIVYRFSVYLFDDGCQMDLKILNWFRGIPVEMNLDAVYIGTAEAQVDWDRVHLHYILQDDSLKATLLAQLPFTDKSVLKKQTRALRSRISAKWFGGGSIEHFYASKDVPGCVEFVKTFLLSRLVLNYDYFARERSMSQSHLQRKMLDILQLLDDPSTLSAKLPPLGQEPPATRERIESAYKDCKMCYIPIRCAGWLGVPENPLQMLEWDMRAVLDAVAPFTISMQGQPLTSVYLLYNDRVDPADLIRHNSAVLSTLFQNELPGCAVLWQIVFLYVLAQKKFPPLKRRFYEEIRFLGEQTEYYLPLKPPFPIVASLNACFWYVAEVSHHAFPNDRRNVLRSFPFNAQLFLQFYRDVYEADYRDPVELPRWRLIRALCLEKPLILKILTHYLDFEKLEENSLNPFQYVLYRGEKGQRRKPCAAYGYLKQLDLETVLRVYRSVLYTNSTYSMYRKFKLGAGIELLQKEEPAEKESSLDHVKIHLRTCHPLVMCPVTHCYWKNCAENDKTKESYLHLFKIYCSAHGKFPSGWKCLMLFFNKSMYKRRKKIPKVFPKSVRQKLSKVMILFQEVINKYTCEEYLKRVKFYKCKVSRILTETLFHECDDEIAENEILDNAKMFASKMNHFLPEIL